MKGKKALALPAIAIGAAGLCIGGPTAAHAGGFQQGHSARAHGNIIGRLDTTNDHTVRVGANGSVKVSSGSAMARTAATGCGGHYSDTTLPSTIRVLRGSGQVDVIPFEDYVKNVLPNEWITSWKPASLQAGAMAVKSFGWYWTNHSANRVSASGQCYDVTDSTSSQVYRPGSATASTNAAVDATWSSRMTRGGGVLQAHYCSTNTACGAWVDGDWMSQYGTQDLAQQGEDYATILRHYYSGVTIDGAGPGPTPPPQHDGKYYEQVWTQAPSYRAASTVNRAGHLNKGRNYFYCQVKGAELNAEGYQNNWWLKTDDDSGNRNVWVNAVYIATGSNDGRIPGVPVCAGSKPKPKPQPSPTAKVYKNVWSTAGSYASPASGRRVGVLHQGRNYFYCQVKGGEVSVDGYRNNWWLKTDDDSGNRNVWVSAVRVSGGVNDGSIPGIPTC